MGILTFAVALSTVTLASALPRTPGGTPRQQLISEYFPDPRYPEQMTNPLFMTVKCTSEGVFPHPYNCAWFYRCHDRIGKGFFQTNYFICEPGTEFDDDLDQCIPKSGTCSDESDIYFCRTLPSSCRTCNGRDLCELQECYSGGRDAGIQRICSPGQLHDGLNCIEVSDCPMIGDQPGECPLNNLRPTAKWTDQGSSCSAESGCRAGKNYQEVLCSSYYDCPEGVKVHRSCPEGYLFSPQWELCMIPPQENCDIIPPQPPVCLPSQGLGDTCLQYSGCRDGQTTEITQTLCKYFICDTARSQQKVTTRSLKFTCPGYNQLFNPDTKSCQQNELSTCPLDICLPENASIWESCEMKTGCRAPSSEYLGELLCQEYSCSDRSGLGPCRPGFLFNSTSKSCVLELTPCPPEIPCTANNAVGKADCNRVSGCTLDGQEVVRTECNFFICADGNQLPCLNGQVFNPETRSCTDPISDVNCPCTVDRAKFWGGCNDVTGCTADNQIEQTENQCNHYSCSITGKEMICENGQVFSPDQRSCVEPLNDAVCPCTVDRAKFWGDCIDVTGCTEDNQTERTEKQCNHYSCSVTGREIRCENGQFFSPNQRSCVEPLNECPTAPDCTPALAKTWTKCTTYCGIDGKRELCYGYSCTDSLGDDTKYCNEQFTEVFDPELKICISKPNECPRNVIPEGTRNSCTPNRANWWYNCSTINICANKQYPQQQWQQQNQQQLQQQRNLCEKYSCEEIGSEFTCDNGQMFDNEKSACITAHTESQC